MGFFLVLKSLEYEENIYLLHFISLNHLFELITTLLSKAKFMTKKIQEIKLIITV